MAPRAMWKGSMGFGMVSVPCKLFSATEEKAVHFNQIHRNCNSRIQMPKYCPQCDRKVEASEIVKGYPVGDDQYVLMEEQDFANLPIKSLKTIDVVAFVSASEIDQRHYNKSYIVAPEDAGLKAFSLFVQAMGKVNKVGIAKLGFREREHLASIRAFDGVILLQTLYYADELRSVDEMKPKQVEVSDREMEMAVTLLQTLMVDNINMSQFKDEYRDVLLKVIEAKLNGQPITVQATQETPAMDLVDALMASINQAQELKPLDTIAAVKALGEKEPVPIENLKAEVD